MSVATEIQRISADKTKMRSKLVSLGLTTSTANLDTIANAVDGIVKRGAPNETVTEGSSYSIQPGYYSGGSISAIAGEGAYQLETPDPVTPTKSQQVITASGSNYGLAQVTVEPIPDSYQDITVTTATQAHVLSPYVFVDANGETKSGNMVNNGTVSKTLDATTGNQSYTVPAGHHSGSGKVQITLETKTATPNTTTQSVTPTNGKVLSKVTVYPIPAKYGDTSTATVTAAKLLAGEKAVGKDASGNAIIIDGAMVSNGAVNGSVGLSTASVPIPAGYTTGGSVTLNSDIEEALALI